MGRAGSTEAVDMPQTRGEAGSSQEGVWITTMWGAEYQIDLDREQEDYSYSAIKPISKHRRGKMSRESLYEAITHVIAEGGSRFWPVVDSEVKDRQIAREAIAGYVIK